MKKNIKYLKYAQIASYAYIILLVVAVFMFASNQSLSYQEVISNHPILTVGFINALINLIIYYQLNPIIENYSPNPRNQGYGRSKLLFFSLIMVLTFNVFSLILLVLSLSNYYPNLSIKQGYQQIKNKNLVKKFWKSNIWIVLLMTLNLLLMIILL